MVVNHVKQLQSSIVVATPFDQQLNIRKRVNPNDD